jgi:hypothetical protein
VPLGTSKSLTPSVVVSRCLMSKTPLVTLCNRCWLMCQPLLLQLFLHQTFKGWLRRLPTVAMPKPTHCRLHLYLGSQRHLYRCE